MSQHTLAAITGLGVVTGLGSNLATIMEHLYQGQTAMGPVERFSKSSLASCLGAELAETDISTAATRWAIQASEAALKQSGWSKRPAAKMAVVFGTTTGETERVKGLFAHLGKQPDDTAALSELIWYRPDTIAHAVCEALDLHGYHVTLSNACATGLFAVDHAIHLLTTGRANVVLVCTVDLLSEFAVAALQAVRALSRHNIRPFDIERSGTLLGDGAGALVLEPFDRQRALGYVRGVAIGCDAFDLAAHRPDGSGMARTMNLALQAAHLSPADIGYLNAHGTGTRKNDEAELAAIEHVFGNYNPALVINSTKPATGHTGAASGIIEMAITLMALKNQSAPPTLFHAHRDPPGNTGVISAHPITISAECAMSNNFGFGGSNGSVVVSLRRPPSTQPVIPSARRVVISGGGICGLDGSTDVLSGSPDLYHTCLQGFRSKQPFYGIDHFASAALAAATRAIQVSGLTQADCAPEHWGIVLGTCYGSASTNREIYQALGSNEIKAVTPFMAINSGFNVACDVLAVEVGARAFAQTIASGELSSLHAIALAAERVRYKRAEIALGLGCDLLIAPLYQASQTAHQTAGKPGRIFQGAICHVLETPEAALTRNTYPMLEVCAAEFTSALDKATSEGWLEFYKQHCASGGIAPDDLHLVISFASEPAKKHPCQAALGHLAKAAHASWVRLEQEVEECGGLAGSLAIARAQAALVKNILICVTDIWGNVGVMLVRSFEGQGPHGH